MVELDAGILRRVVCQCKDDEQYELWVTNVNKVLQRQMDLIIGESNQQETNREQIVPSSRTAETHQSLNVCVLCFSSYQSNCCVTKRVSY